MARVGTYDFNKMDTEILQKLKDDGVFNSEPELGDLIAAIPTDKSFSLVRDADGLCTASYDDGGSPDGWKLRKRANSDKDAVALLYLTLKNKKK